MNYLLDTHLLLWAAGEPGKLSRRAFRLIENHDNSLTFSAASIWEIAIKTALGRADFQVSPSILRRGLINHGYEELVITGRHAAAVADLPSLHKDPFDRMLVAQASVEGLKLLTNDPEVAAYQGPIELV